MLTTTQVPATVSTSMDAATAFSNPVQAMAIILILLKVLVVKEEHEEWAREALHGPGINAMTGKARYLGGVPKTLGFQKEPDVAGLVNKWVLQIECFAIVYVLFTKGLVSK